MFKNFVIHYTPVFILLILIIFSFIKLSGMSKLGRANKNSSTFFGSFLPKGKGQIRNAGDSRLQAFLRKNNDVNYIMYAAVGIVIGLYMFMSAI